RAIEVAHHDGVDLTVEAFDALDVALGQLERADLTGADQARELAGGLERDVGRAAHRGAPRRRGSKGGRVAGWAPCRAHSTAGASPTRRIGVPPARRCGSWWISWYAKARALPGSMKCSDSPDSIT